jgi:hypothetical protein
MDRATRLTLQSYAGHTLCEVAEGRLVAVTVTVTVTVIVRRRTHGGLLGRERAGTAHRRRDSCVGGRGSAITILVLLLGREEASRHNRGEGRVIALTVTLALGRRTRALGGTAVRAIRIH